MLSCLNCTAACCRPGMLIPLSDDEVVVMKRNLNPDGLLDETQLEIQTIPLATPVYRLKKTCKYLHTGKPQPNRPQHYCSLFHDPRRPKACIQEQPGDPACLEARKRYGVTKTDPLGGGTS